ncbi:MAG: DUF4139 domain-containing protein [Sedimentisphaerales bacterium]|nr:DUF4139 domain-containing protein [Sedimentisphaerales bacterium]
MSKNHLIEKDLIEFQFKLASDERNKEIAAHLKSCSKCAEQLEKLKRKFAALDLLKGEVKVPAQLVSDVVKQTQKPQKAKIFSLTKSAWLSAAAVIVFGIVFFSNMERTNPIPKQTPGPNTFSIPPVSIAPNLEDKGLSSTPALTNGAMQGGLPVQTLTASTAKVETSGSAENLGIDKIGEQPYFPPASAIELNVLPKRDNVQLTIYNSADLTLVREKRNVTVKRGWNWIQFMWVNTLIDPTSLSIEPKEHKDQIDIQALVFPARLRQIGRWLIRSEVSGQVPFEITYLTSGLSWRAFYMGTLSEDEKSMEMEGYVRVTNNSGEDYENAQTRLIVGKVHMLDEISTLAQKQYPYDRPTQQEGQNVLFQDAHAVEKARVVDDFMLGLDGDVVEFGWSGSVKQIIKEGLSEYFLYTIDGTETIENEWSKRLLSFEANDIEVESLYKYDEGRYGNQTIRFVKFANDEDHNLGETPIPDGNVKIYGIASEDGLLSYVGGTNVKYIPVNEEVELNLGSARLVEVKPTMIDFKTDNYLYDSNRIVGWDEIRTWKIEITNAKRIQISIEVTRDFATQFWTMESETSYDKYDATRVRFNLNIEPQSKREIEYTVTTYHGTREDQLN